MRKSVRPISPVYTILVEAINAYCDRTQVARPTKDRWRAKLIGISVTIMSGIKRGRWRLSQQMARGIVMILCEDEPTQRALEARLHQPVTTAPDGTVHPPLVSFVRRWGKRDAAILIEHMGRWPFAWGFDYPDAPMIAAFRDAMAAGTNVIVFLPYAVHERDYKTSMGDRFAELYARRTFGEIAKIDPTRVGFYCLEENSCPVPDMGVRLTGLCPNERHECVWLIPHGPHDDMHLVTTNTYPKDVVLLILGFAWTHLRDGNGPPTQEDLDRRWKAEHNIRQIDGAPRPCPIRRIA